MVAVELRVQQVLSRNMCLSVQWGVGDTAAVDIVSVVETGAGAKRNVRTTRRIMHMTAEDPPDPLQSYNRL